MNLLLYYIVVAIESLAANLAHPITPTLIHNLNLPDYMFGLMFAGMSVTNFLFSPFWGLEALRKEAVSCPSVKMARFRA